MKKTRRKTISILLSFVMLLGILPAAALTAYAEPDGFFTVTFDGNGNSGTILELKVPEGSSIEQALDDLPNSEGWGLIYPLDATNGKYLAGWYDDSSCTAGHECELDSTEITGDITFYAYWVLPLTEAKIVVKAPLCGKETACPKSGDSFDWAEQTNKPQFSVPDGENYFNYYEEDDATYSYWLVSPEDDLSPFIGTFEAGKSYTGEYWIAAKRGYCFNSDTNVTVEGGTLVNRLNYNSDGYDEIIIYATVVAEHDWGEWKVTKQATAKEEGLKERICNGCGAAETEKIPPLESKSPPTGDDAGLTAVILMLVFSSVAAAAIIFGSRSYRQRRTR